MVGKADTDVVHVWLGDAGSFVLVKQSKCFVEPQFIPATTCHQVTKVLQTTPNTQFGTLYTDIQPPIFTGLEG